MKIKILLTSLLFSQTIGAQSFTEATNTPFEGVWQSSIALADIDSDGDQDLMITGWSNSLPRVIAKLYTNDGNGNFIEVMDTPFEGAEYSSIAFADVDNDQDQDLLITGYNNSESTAKLYTNDGNGNFIEITDTPFEGVAASSIAFADVDNDQDQDLLITGFNNDIESVSKLYINDSNGNFIETEDTPFDGVQQGSIAFADVDSDGDQDLLITGQNNNSVDIAKLYSNDGNGNFIEVIDTPFDGVEYSAIAFADIDNDQDQDLLITGINNASETITKLYTNDGNGDFIEIMDTPFENTVSSSIAFTDVDNDQDQDLLITGYNNSERIAKLYTNDGNGNFIEIMDTPFDGVSAGSIAFKDVDSDGDKDLLITGRNNNFVHTSKLYINDLIVSSSNTMRNEINPTFTSFPNPSAGSVLYMHYTVSEKTEAKIKVYDTNGILLQQQSELVNEGQQVVPINIKDLNPGIFLLELELKGKRRIATFVVQ